jgi:hypothetical protein
LHEGHHRIEPVRAGPARRRLINPPRSAAQTGEFRHRRVV